MFGGNVGFSDVTAALTRVLTVLVIARAAEGRGGCGERRDRSRVAAEVRNAA